ncbi:hypothetical protein KNE206_66500 [Kitasatospora sp. NE20-6]
MYRPDGSALWSTSTYSYGHHSAGTESGSTGKVRWGDFGGDGKANAFTIADNGSISVKLNKGCDVVTSGWYLRPRITNGAITAELSSGGDDFATPGRYDRSRILPAVRPPPSHNGVPAPPSLQSGGGSFAGRSEAGVVAVVLLVVLGQFMVVVVGARTVEPAPW